MRTTTHAVPKVLYHYTSAEALLGLVQSKSLWATDIRFLNDTEEFTFARDLILSEVTRRASRLRNERVRSIVSEQLSELTTRAIPRAYVVSLSERGNALSQWRAYAPRDGVAIGFHHGALGAVKDFALYRCEYLNTAHTETKQDRKAIDVIVDDVYCSVQWAARLIQGESRKVSAGGVNTMEAQREHASLIAHTIVWAALKIKHAGFSEESEWRLVDNMPGLNLVHALGDDPNEFVHFRRGAFGVTPYLVAALPELWEKAPLGIAKIVVGPSSNAVATVASIQDLLRFRLQSLAPVEYCGIPYRAW